MIALFRDCHALENDRQQRERRRIVLLTGPLIFLFFSFFFSSFSVRKLVYYLACYFGFACRIFMLVGVLRVSWKGKALVDRSLKLEVSWNKIWNARLADERYFRDWKHRWMWIELAIEEIEMKLCSARKETGNFIYVFYFVIVRNSSNNRAIAYHRNNTFIFPYEVFNMKDWFRKYSQFYC